MPLESGTYISDLVSTNPAAADSVGQADDHLRFIKATLLASFAAITGAVTATHTQLNAAVSAVVTGLAQAVHIAGSVGAPGVAFLGSLTSGLYSPAANQVAVATNGILAALFKADQSLTLSGALATTGAYSGGTGQLGIIGEPRLWLSNTLPSGSFAWLNGGTLSRAGNPVLFALWGTTYGVGDGSTTFNVPNWQGITPVGRATMGGAADPGLVTNAGITTLGTIIGEGKHLLAQNELPNVTPTFTGNAPSTGNAVQGVGGPTQVVSGSGVLHNVTTLTFPTPTGSISSINGNVTEQAHNVVQPSFVCNWIVLIG